MEYEFRYSEENSKGLIEMWKGGDCFARMTYSRLDPNNIIVDHTAVDPKAKGKGAGKRIVMEMVEWARKNNQKVLPLCPFTKAIIEKHPETHDILRK
jgi:predicted GNAT family acetyltransferase